MDQFYKDSFRSNSQTSTIFFSSSCDRGVILNKGRNGARYAPQAILHSFGKFNQHKERSFTLKSLSSNQKELSLHEQQLLNITEITESLKGKTDQQLIHLGGGHDHIYSFAMAIEKISKDSIVILNLDAHLDTRINEPNSGTPFRQLDEDLKGPVHLIQYGIQFVSNSKSTASNLKNIKQETFTIEQIEAQTKSFKKKDKVLLKLLNELSKKASTLIISLDCDVIDGGQFQAVSAVNGRGIPCQYLLSLLHEIKKIDFQHKHLGIYEYNPVFDNLSNFGSRYLAQFIEEFLA